MTEWISTDSTKKISDILALKIREANTRWGSAKEAVMEVYNQALSEGWRPQEAGKLCRERLTIFHVSTLYRILPGESKNQAMKALAERRLASSNSVPSTENTPRSHMRATASAVENTQSPTQKYISVDKRRLDGPSRLMINTENVFKLYFNEKYEATEARD